MGKPEDRRRVDRARCVHPDCACCHDASRRRLGVEVPELVRELSSDVCGCSWCGCRWTPTVDVFREGYRALLEWAYRNGNSYTRLPLLLSWEPKVPRRVFLRLLGEVWSDCDNIEHPKYLKRVWSLLPDRPCWSMMDSHEREELKALPETVMVYRGADEGVGEFGPSWSLERRVAAGFPFLARYRAAVPLLLTGSVRRSRITAVKLGRNEFEVISKHVAVTSRERLNEPATPGGRAGGRRRRNSGCQRRPHTDGLSN